MFRTELPVNESEKKITLNDPVVTVGSCFADNIGDKLKEYKFNVVANPFGVVYNPLSIFKLLNYCIDKKYPNSESYVSHEDIFYNYEFHSDFSAISKESLRDQVERCIDSISIILPMTRWIVITFGTAIIYKRKDNKELVSNCHKVPAKEFNREMLTQKKILNAFEDFYNKFSGINPEANIILTVSPVRHLKEEIINNSVSKSILRIVCNTLVENYKNVDYFPAFELMMDDLRDYRFYESDMLHPNEEARNYIWNKFSKGYFDQGTLDFITEWGKLIKALNHKPFHPESKQHREFLTITLEKLENFADLIDVNEEIDQIKKQLNEAK